MSEKAGETIIDTSFRKFFRLVNMLQLSHIFFWPNSEDEIALQEKMDHPLDSITARMEKSAT